MAFKSLVSVVSEQCQEIKQGLALFPYFNSWDKTIIAECCRLGSILEFPPDTVILGASSKPGDDNLVYFILEGTCVMICYLCILIKNVPQKKINKSNRLADSSSTCTESTKTGFASILFNDSSNLREEKLTSDANNDKFVCQTDVNVMENQSKKILNNEENIASEKPEKESLEKAGDTNHKEEKLEECIVYEADHHLKVLEECRKKFGGRKRDKDCHDKLPDGYEGVFVRAAVFHKGACFGLEKNKPDRYIVSKTRVKCLAIPRRFLLQHNPCNIWNRIRLFHRLYLPKDEDILKSVMTERKWKHTIREETETVAFSKSVFNSTSVSDVPVSVRLDAFLR